jgi:glutamate-1-semialdehyde 2,1-aminomutase
MASSKELFAAASKVIPGGVNSPVRAFGAVGGTPRFFARGQGARVWDVDGREYIDYVGSWGPLILGHAPPEVVEAVCRAARLGTSFGAPTPGEVELAEAIVRRMKPADGSAGAPLEMVRLVTSGTEATMTALRLARAITTRTKVLKFAGCYHGHSDAFLVAAGSGALTFGTPSSPGVPASVAGETLVTDYNDIAAMKRLFQTHGSDIAAIIVEPICGNVGVIPPEPGFLEQLRAMATGHCALLIFDEVITGFRVAPGGAQQLYGVRPDLTTLGKIIGGGLPIGAIAGPRKIMENLAPTGPVYQAGTLSGNPVAVAAGLATLRALDNAMYERLEALGRRLEEGLRENLKALSLPYPLHRVGSMLCLFFTDRPVHNARDAETCDRRRFAAYFHAMLDRGIYLPPSQFETFFVSAAHTEADLDRTIKASRESLESAHRQPPGG